MILLLDVGNSRLKWALARGPRLAHSGAVAHRGAPARALRSLRLPQVEAVWMSHVVGPHERELARAIRRRFGISPHIARSQKSCGGLRVAYSNPSRLGVDRFLAMLALWSAGYRSFCLASAGTALTFDAVDAR